MKKKMFLDFSLGCGNMLTFYIISFRQFKVKTNAGKDVLFGL